MYVGGSSSSSAFFSSDSSAGASGDAKPIVEPLHQKMWFIASVLLASSVGFLPLVAYMSKKRQKTFKIDGIRKMTLCAGATVEIIDVVSDFFLLRDCQSLKRLPTWNFFSVPVLITLILSMGASLGKLGWAAYRMIAKNDPSMKLFVPMLNIFAFVTSAEGEILKAERYRAMWGLVFRVVEDIPLCIVSALLVYYRRTEVDAFSLVSLCFSIAMIINCCGDYNAIIGRTLPAPSPPISLQPGAPQHDPNMSFAGGQTIQMNSFKPEQLSRENQMEMAMMSRGGW